MYFVQIPIKTIYMALLKWAITANIGKMSIMAVMDKLVTAKNMVFISVFLKYSKNKINSKTVYKNMELVKSYDKHKFVNKTMAISFVFLA